MNAEWRGGPGGRHSHRAGAIEWHDALSVGAPELDAHHRHLAGLINRLADLAGDAARAEGAHGVLTELAHYATYHFEQEEALMRALGFPGLDEHRAEHEQYCEVIAEASYGATLGIIAVGDLLGYLTRWWSTHIRNEDMKLKPFLASSHPYQTLAGNPPPSRRYPSPKQEEHCEQRSH